MKAWLRFFLGVGAVLFGLNLQAQDKALNAEQLLSIVRQNHPVVRQAQIGVEKAQADILRARAAFDPILSHYQSTKNFDGKTYYAYSSPQLSIPTWFGVELNAGLEQLSGKQVDPTKTFGQSSYLGISIPLMRDLVIDKRRAALQQSKLLQSMAQQEQRNTINALMADALDAYWTWVKSYQVWQVLKKAVKANQDRLQLIKRSYALGERPAVDTLEATSQWQYFQQLEQAADLQFRKSGIELSVYLWDAEANPVYLNADVIPVDAWEQIPQISSFPLDLDQLIQQAEQFHPELQAYNFKISALEVDQKLKFQSLLPKVDLNYQQLSPGYNWFESFAQSWGKQNFLFGLKMEMPLRLSEGRGAYRQSRLKVEESTLDRNQKRNQIIVKIRQYHQEFQNLKGQIQIQNAAFINYQRLVAAEEDKFKNGESSLFLINNRELKALESLEKLIDLKIKWLKSIYLMQYSAGLLS